MNNKYVHTYRAKNPERARFQSRRATLKHRRGIEPDYTFEQWYDRVAAYLWCCAYCGVPLTEKPNQPNTLTQDHIVPVSLGGSDSITNVVPCCKSCNGHKYTKSWTPLTPDQLMHVAFKAAA